MRVLFVGDVVGEPGRRAVRALVPILRERHSVDAVIANGENSAGGSGLTSKTAEEILAAGVDVVTTGDHVWDQKEVMTVLPIEPRVLRPLNYPAGTIGQGSRIFEVPGKGRLGVINLQGRVFMPELDNPFTQGHEEVQKIRAETRCILIDFHAEATSEKIALARFLDGQISALIGTHTHVQTADEQIFPGGTAFLCDAGFTGPHESVLGREIEPVVKRFLTYTPQRFHVARDRVLLQGAIVDIDESTGRATAITRVSEPLPEALKE